MRQMIVLAVLALAAGAQAQCGCEARIAAIEALVNTMASQSCQAGAFRVENCNSDFENFNDVLQNCITVPINGGSGFTKTIDVTFPASFTAPPVVDIGLSGIALAQGQNQSAFVSSVTESGFSVTYEVDDFVPVTSDINWFACPSPALGPGQPGLGPIGDGSDSCCGGGGNNGGDSSSSGGDSRRR